MSLFGGKLTAWWTQEVMAQEPRMLFWWFLFLVGICNVQANEHGHDKELSCMTDKFIELGIREVIAPQTYDENNLNLVRKSLHARRTKRQNANDWPDGVSKLRLRMDTTFLTKGLDSKFACETAGAEVKVHGGGDYTCKSEDLLTTSKIDFVKRIIGDAQDLLTSALGVIPVEGKLTLKKDDSPKKFPNNCWSSDDNVHLTIPDQYLEPNGVANTDMVIFVTARPLEDDNVLGFAGPCQFDSKFRPVAGWLNFNPAALDPDSVKYASQLGFATHEATHALGFISRSWTRFWDIEAEKIRPESQVLVHEVINSPEKRNITKVVTPTVRSWVRDHFSCNTLNGAEIENQGGSGTAGGHWEKRIFNTEYMIGTISAQPVFSGLTLSALQDSGWYWANFTVASQFRWGLKEGCSFVESRCSNWDSRYFCTKLDYGCTFDRAAKGVCSISDDIQGLNVSFQYFENPKKGGIDTLADFCPYYSAQSSEYCTDPNNAGSSIKDKFVNIGEKYCEKCRCFGSTLIKDVPTANTASLGCYEIYCTSSKNLKINIGGLWYNCPVGEKIKAAGFGGALTCPQDNNLCFGAEEDPNWPEFESIEPSIGPPGTVVVINGEKFTEGMEIIIDQPAQNCEFISEKQYKCNIADSSQFRNPVHLLKEPSSVIMIDTQKRSTVGYQAFQIDIDPIDFFLNTVEWMAENPLWTGLIGGGVILSCITCCYCCWRERRKTLEGRRYGHSRRR